jgi:hypothetical protein
MHERKEECIKTYGEKTRRKATLCRPGHRWESNIKMDLVEIAWICVACIHLD